MVERKGKLKKSAKTSKPKKRSIVRKSIKVSPLEKRTTKTKITNASSRLDSVTDSRIKSESNSGNYDYNEEILSLGKEIKKLGIQSKEKGKVIFRLKKEIEKINTESEEKGKVIFRLKNEMEQKISSFNKFRSSVSKIRNSNKFFQTSKNNLNNKGIDIWLEKNDFKLKYESSQKELSKLKNVERHTGRTKSKLIRNLPRREMPIILFLKILYISIKKFLGHIFFIFLAFSHVTKGKFSYKLFSFFPKSSRARAFIKFSKKLRHSDIDAAINFAEISFDLNPEPYIGKWLAFTLFKKGYFQKSYNILNSFKKDVSYSQSEFKLKEQIESHYHLFNSIPNLDYIRDFQYNTNNQKLMYLISSSRPYNLSGYTIRSHEFIKSLKDQGVDVSVFTRPGYPWDRSDTSSNTNLNHTSFSSITYNHIKNPSRLNSIDVYWKQSANELMKRIRHYKISHVMAASDYFNAVPALIAAKRLKIPFFYDIRGFWHLSRDSKEVGFSKTDSFKFSQKYEGFVVKNADYVFCISEEMKDYIIELYGVKSNKILVLPNGVNEDALIAQKPTKKNICFAGSLEKYEGIDLLLKALSLFRKNDFDFVLNIIGKGSEENNLKKIAKSYGLSKKVKFWGQLSFEKARKHLLEASLICLPRIDEKVCHLVPPLKLTEAIALNKPVLLPDFKIFRNIISKHNHKAYFFSPNSEKDLHHTIKKAFSNSEDFDYLLHLGPKEDLLWSFKIKKILNKIGFSSNNTNNISIKGSTNQIRQKKSNIKCLTILDEISELSWSNEFNSFRIDRNNFHEQLLNSTSDFAFLESCWKGNSGQWIYGFTSPGLKHANAQDLLNVIQILKIKNIPIVFWNKEDPMHYERFLPIAKLADIIFTTDDNMVKSYLKDTKVKKVFCLPFGVNSSLSNPVNRNRIKQENICFAGTYYGKGHADRLKQMKYILPVIKEFNGVIYDRMSDLNNDVYKFPDVYKEFIRPSVPFNEMNELYKSFRVFLNVNTITNSPTMISRRVYELLGSGTPVISTPSLAIDTQFNEIVQSVSNKKEAINTARLLLDDKLYYNKISHLGYREAHLHHSYSHRKYNILDALSKSIPNRKPLISVVCCSMRPQYIERMAENFTCQNYSNIELIFVLQGFKQKQIQYLKNIINDANSNIVSLKIFSENNINTLGERFNYGVSKSSGEYISKMDDDDLYFSNYLSDMMIPFNFNDYGLVGKKEIFMYLESENKLIKRYNNMSHIETDFLSGPTFLMPSKVVKEIPFLSRNTGEDSTFIKNVLSAGYKVYSADAYNFINWRSSDNLKHTWKNFDTQQILSSNQTKVIANSLNKEIVDI